MRSKQAVERLYNQHKRLAYRLLNQFYPCWYRDKASLDMEQDAMIGLLDAAHRWDSKKGKFSTIAYWRVRAALQAGRRSRYPLKITQHGWTASKTHTFISVQKEEQWDHLYSL